MTEQIINPPAPVAKKIQWLLNNGAVPTDLVFSLANDNQADLVYQDRRLLITENDKDYEKYRNILKLTDLPAIENIELGDDSVVVGEIPRDSRSLPQFVRSVQSEVGMNRNDAVR